MLAAYYALNVAVFFALLWLFVSKTINCIFSPLFWYFVFHFIVFIARPLGVCFFEFDSIFNYMKISPTHLELERGLLVSIVGLVAINVGYYLGWRGAQYNMIQIQVLSPRLKGVFGFFSVFAVPIVLYSMFSGTGGPQGQMVEGVYILVGTNGYLLDAQLMVLPLSLLLLVVGRFSFISCVPLVVYLCYSMVFGRVRWMLIVALIAGYMMYCQFVKKRISLVPIMVLGPLVALVFYVKGVSRDVFALSLSGERGGVGEVFSGPINWRERLDFMDFANFDFLVYITSVVPGETHSFTYFTQWLQLFTEPIPRALWAAKPVGAPIQYFNLNDYGNFVGLTNSVVGDGWLSFGWIGVVITCGLVGYILALIYRFVCARTGDPVLVCSYCIFCALTIQLYRDGGISIFKFVLFSVVPLLVLRLMAGGGSFNRPNFKTVG